MTNSEKFDIDYLKMYFADPYQLTEDIVIYQPTIGDIIDFGEQYFYTILYIFIGNSTTHRVRLWEAGIDWNKISDFEIFVTFVKALHPEATKLLFGDFDFSQMDAYMETTVDEEGNPQKKLLLSNKDQTIKIREEDYNRMAFYLRTMFNIFPKVEKAKGKSTKEWIIEEEKMNMKAKEKEAYRSNMLPMISACLNHPGFKYKKNELREVGIFEFMDSAQRLQVYESTTALLKGVYSGMVDTKKINKEEFNFMREITPA